MCSDFGRCVIMCVMCSVKFIVIKCVVCSPNMWCVI